MMIHWRTFLRPRLRRWLEHYIYPAATDPKLTTYHVPASEWASLPLVRIAALQSSGELHREDIDSQRKEVIANAFSLLDMAAQHKADLALLPERFSIRGIALSKEQAWEWAQVEGDTLFQRLADTARCKQMSIIAPVPERRGTRLFNVAWIFSRQGDFLGRYCKVHLTQVERERGYTPGDSWPVFDMGFAHMGVMICHDNSFPESARCLMLNGAQLLCWPHNQSGWGDVAWESILRARAIDNDVYMVSACCGTPANRAWSPGMVVGRSSIVAPDGSWLADAGRGVGLAVAAISLNTPRWINDFSAGGIEDYRNTVLAERRVDTYRVLV